MRQVVVGAQLVRHRVADAQEGIGEGHTGHAGGVGHLLAGVRIVCALVIGGRQVGEDVLHRLERQAVGVVGGHD